MTGLKVNLLKTKVMEIGISSNETANAAALLGYQIGTFPITYLGIPPHFKYLKVSDWNFLVDKIDKKLTGWKKKKNKGVSTLAGRLALIISVRISPTN